MAGVSVRAPSDYGKAAFFVFLAICTAGVIYADEKFLLIHGDPEWAHIKPFQGWLLPHGLVGLVALICGPFQFSDKLRIERPALHRAIGYTFIVTGGLTAILGWLITYLGFEPKNITVEEYFHGGLIVFSMAMAFVCIRAKNIQAHKIWMMRAYLVLLIFVWARLPDVFGHRMNDAELSDVLWSCDVIGVLAPSLALDLRDLMRRRAKRAAA